MLLAADEAADGAADDVVAVRNLLSHVADGLARGSDGYRFPRFRLVQWLMNQEFDGALPVEDRIADLRDRLRERALRRKTVPDDAVAGMLPPWVRALGWALPPLYFRVRHSGRVPGVGRRYRWFLRQPNLAPGLSRSFVWLAERLTAGQWPDEDREQVRRLLVNAFLEDLREAFRGAGWTRRYRTTVPIVLLDGITEANGGFALLRTVSAVRNETGRYDPLLLVTTSTRVPTPAPPEPRPDPAPGTTDDKKGVLDRWRARLPQGRRKRDVVAWLIVGRIPGPPAGVTDPAIRRPSRPRLRTRRAAALVVSTVLAAVVATYVGLGYAHSERTCRDRFTWLLVESAASDVTRIDGNCVGVTDGSNALVLPDGAIFDQVRTTILDQNRRRSSCTASSPTARSSRWSSSAPSPRRPARPPTR